MLNFIKTMLMKKKSDAREVSPVKDEVNVSEVISDQEDSRFVAESPTEEAPVKDVTQSAEESSHPSPMSLEEAFCLGAGVDAESFAKAKAIIADIASMVSSQVFSPKLMQLALRLLNYDKTLEEARKEGFERGKKENLLKAASIPNLGGIRAPNSMRESIFDVARGS